MRLPIVLATLFIATPALAHDTGEEHEHPEAVGKQLEGPGKFTVGAAVGYAFGGSLGGDYEKCEGGTTCSDRKRPGSFAMLGRVGYQLRMGLGFELDLGLYNFSSRVARNTTLFGEQSNPVKVNIVDETTVGGPFVGANVTYNVIEKPIVATVALGIAQWFTTVSVKRTGTAVTDAPPSPRAMSSSSVEETTSFTMVVPEIRAALPIAGFLQVGVSVGAFAAIGESRPRVTQTPQTSATDPRPSSNGKPIGFVPQPSSTPESAIDSPILFRSALFVRALF